MNDTICAIATPLGSGGIGIVRVSGPDVIRIAREIFGRCPNPRIAEFGDFLDAKGECIDSGIALYFPKPKSFTGEDVLELQGHGGRVVQELVCERVRELGARLARAGEFTERAFLEGRLDLAQAEAVADLISASSAQAARASARSLSGEFSREVLAIDREVLELRTYIEGAIDFAEEEIDFLDDKALIQRASIAEQRLQTLLRRTELGAAMKNGLRVVIAGSPNVGKSSLLNALLNEDRAIVTDIAGTTRDTLDATINLDGVPIHLIDTAGLHQSDDPIEEAGIRRTRMAMEQADLTLWVVDDRAASNADEAPNCKHLIVRNKCDLSERPPGVLDEGAVRVSALYQKGLSTIRDFLMESAGFQVTDDAFAGRPRHIKSLTCALEALQRAISSLESKSGEVVAEDLREVHKYLGDVVGETTTDELLGEIFSRFCIGK
ncbi:MAG: tRNA uridine-5-carboxymethylaminomethyl(34) synthesis GTPase MnmE [Gammaproteobacteria bacterium]|nr:tRNA uridine-5-carboxymethylaminomethyl(34) synthesis GTPase MnmE [Gammaproteobacteria bacterium]MYD80809.1 tRNA uridine-5-carboxymethylaminomethyl(34) synthesis GTPase MnmE [Gammaproteobacteria bacterium]